MLWIDLPQLFTNGDVEVSCYDGLHFRGPLADNDAIKFCKSGGLLTLELSWTKKRLPSGEWIDFEPKTIEIATTSTRIREVGSGKIRINMVISTPPVPPSKFPGLKTIGEITIHPHDDETAQWHTSVGAPTLATVVVT